MKQERLVVSNWHWFYALSGGATSLALAFLTPDIDLWTDRPVGTMLLGWTLLVSVFLGGLLWGLTHTEKKLSLPIWALLSLSSLPVSIGFIALQLDPFWGLLCISSCFAILIALVALYTSQSHFIRLFVVYVGMSLTATTLACLRIWTGL